MDFYSTIVFWIFKENLKVILENKRPIILKKLSVKEAMPSALIIKSKQILWFLKQNKNNKLTKMKRILLREIKTI